ncbi:MAG: hypothetical protein JW715_06355 [Sedimentisphaerales bacterium]|nr:hypothetical protein [Sedimentisphaerales bacterium]
MKTLIMPENQTMRTSSLQIVTFIVVVLYGTFAFALDPIGPPATNIEQSQFVIGAEFSHSEMDLELKNGMWIEYLDGVFWDTGDAVDLKIKDFEVNRSYVHLGYGIADNCEAFFRLGGSSAEFGDSIWEDSENFDSRSEPAIGIGIKATFYEDDYFQLGGLFQTNWAEYDGKLDASHWAAPDFVEVDTVEVQLALGLTCKLSDSVSVYAGPFAHFVSGELNDTYSEVDSGTGGLLNSKYIWDIEQDSVLGGFFGARAQLSENCFLNIELQHTSSSEAFGLGIAWRF